VKVCKNCGGDYHENLEESQNCPKWVEGRFNHERFRKSASTRVWGEAEQFREKLEEALSRGLPQTVFTRTRSRHPP